MPETLTLNTDYGLKRKTKYNVLIKTLGGGYEQRVLKSSTKETQLTLVFKERLTATMQTSLYKFYCARCGATEAFNITDPLSGTTRLVRFMDDLEETFLTRLTESVPSLPLLEVAG